MKATESTHETKAGLVGWTRDLARDLFPGPTTPFAWTLLRGPAAVALQDAYTELGATISAGESFWRLADGYVFLNADAVALADEKLRGAAWLGPAAGQAPAGLLGRLQTGGAVKRAQARLDAVAGEAAGLQTRLARWLTWARGLRWTQADVLQVMEELEPHAIAALRIYFLARAALNAASAALRTRLDEWLPTLPATASHDLYLAVDNLLCAQAAIALSAAARLPESDPERLTTLARHGHRGPGEIRPDAHRWADAPALFKALDAVAEPQARLAAAQHTRRAAEATLRARLSGSQGRQFDALLARSRQALVATDAAWDALTLVMAAAQRWLTAAGLEALATGLIARREDALFLELEELKQIATGEWHGGRSTEVQAETRRRNAALAAQSEPPVKTQPTSEVIRGACAGPLYLDSPDCVLPPPGAVWLADALDPGCLPFWPDACAVCAVGGDIWAPGLIAARSLGIPAIVGLRREDATT